MFRISWQDDIDKGFENLGRDFVDAWTPKGKNTNQSGSNDFPVTKVLRNILILLLFIVNPIFFVAIAIFSGLILLIPQKRWINYTSIISILILGISLFMGSWKDFFQFLGVYPRIFSPIQTFYQRITHAFHVPMTFHLTINTFIQTITLAMIVTSCLYFLSKRLQKNWFTKEKEQQREDYIQSNKYKQFFEKRKKIGEKHQKSYRKSGRKDIYVGINEYGKDIFFPVSSTKTHMLIQATTGAGKTTLMYAIMESALLNGYGSVFIDGKGDGTTEAEIKKLADNYGKKVFVFSDDTDYRYNPVKYGGASAIKDRLMDTMTWSDPFYEKEAENQLQQIIKFIIEYIKIEEKRGHRATQGDPLRKDIATIHRFLSLKEIANYLFIEQSEYVITKDYSENDMYKKETKTETSDNKESYETTYKEYMRMFFGKEELTLEDIENIESDLKESNKYIRGLRTQLELLIYSDLGKKFVDDPEKTLDIKKILLEGNIVLFSLDTNSYSRFMESIGRFIVSDVAAIVSHLYKMRHTTGYKGAIGFFDEFGSYVNEKILDILRKARTAKLGAIIGVQSISDFETSQGDLTKKARNNINIYFLGRSNDPENAEDSANTVGTYRDIDRTVMTENKGNSFLRMDTKGERGTVRKVNKYWFGPDEIKDMPNYTFIYVNKTTDQLESTKEKVFIRNVLEGLNDK